MLASVLHYCSGNPLQNLSGVDRRAMTVGDAFELIRGVLRFILGDPGVRPAPRPAPRPGVILVPSEMRD